ncbi:unnamed protein product [Staurois parvus]|uniref:Secreted protein n=1 Tax=Staurois parvus TaxID=386267 RepID=A0ABN9D2H0_9NEOB|nr:unnamed protein product [Staurois parvus]
MAVLCTAILSSVLELTGRKTVCKQNNLPPCWRSLVITGCLQVITGRDPVIDTHGRKCQHAPPTRKCKMTDICDSVHRCRPAAVYLL